MKQFDVERGRVVSPLCNRNRVLLIGLIVVFGTLLGVIIWQATKTGNDDNQNDSTQAAQQANCPTPSTTMTSVVSTVPEMSSTNNKQNVVSGNPVSGTIKPPSITSHMTSFPPQISQLPAMIGNLTVDESVDIRVEYSKEYSLNISLQSDRSSLRTIENCAHSQSSDGTASDMCLEINKDSRLGIKHITENTSNKTRNQTFGLSKLDCYDIEWTALNCPKQVLQMCLDVSTSHWYGGYADKHQFWPFEKNMMKPSAYLVNDSYIGEIGGMIERYFISSSGFGIYVDDNVPLFFSLNDPDNGTMCFTAKYDNYPYFNLDNRLPFLKFRLCHDDNVKAVHMGMSGLFIDKPSDIPDVNLFRYPIWSTWAQFHKDINQTNVMNYANAILFYNFTHSQIEIDDDWTPAYGDMTFNEDKFPNATVMVSELNDLGFRVTAWVHPFFNADSRSFVELAEKGYLVKQRDSLILALTPWWDGKLAGILDVSNENAIVWYLEHLRNLTENYNISSFKFDAGETSWLPHIYSIANMSARNPSHVYPGKWVELALKADPDTRHQEVRAMYRTQRYPIFVRMMDKFSDWSHVNGLKSIIPGVLTYGILGYPFVLPDMIGGNAYDNQPSAELFIRWIQLNTFLPSLQFSIVPWNYNETVISIVRIFTELHEQISDTLIKYARNAVITGEPIIRPLWWLAPDDEYALVCEDEFLLGDEYLVAPIVDQGARSRNIYFPSGNWSDKLRGGTIAGPVWRYNYTADIDELPYFISLG